MPMPASFRVSVVTPEREVLALEARSAVLPVYDGELGILARRAPLLVELGPGMLRLVAADGSRRELFLGGGFAQWVSNRLTVLAEEALELDAISSTQFNEAEATLAQPVPHSDREYEAYERLVRRARFLRRLRGSGNEPRGGKA